MELVCQHVQRILGMGLQSGMGSLVGNGNLVRMGSLVRILGSLVVVDDNSFFKVN